MEVITREKLIIKGINESVTEQDIKNHFIDCGPIENVFIRKSSSSIYAEILFKDKSSLYKALDKNCTQIKNSNISLFINSRPSNKHKQDLEEMEEEEEEINSIFSNLDKNINSENQSEENEGEIKDKKGNIEISEKENEQQQMGVKMVEEIMSECGDMILKIFHNHNLTYSNGINFENLLEIIQKSDDQESLKVLNMINEKFMKKLMDNFINGMKPKKEKKEVKKENKQIATNNIKCNDCLSKKVKKIEVKPNLNDFDVNLLNLPNLLGFNENIEKEKKKKNEKEKKFKFEHGTPLVDNTILLNKII